MLLALLAALAACGTPRPPESIRGESSRLPEFAQPRAAVSEIPRPPEHAIVRYRDLTREDFLATSPPAEIAAHRNQIGAFTCGQIRPVPGTRALVLHTPDAPPGEAYRASLDGLAFEAFVDPACSWWNPEPLGLPDGYVLEHEQIHFALFELTARRLNARLPEILATSSATGASGEEAAERSRDRVIAVLADAMKDAMQEHARFDEDTSFGYAPEKQATWRTRVEQELASRSP